MKRQRRIWHLSTIGLVVAWLIGLHSPVVVAASDCPTGKQLNVVAHADDDLLFMSPDLASAISSGKCVRTVFVTAGDANGSATYWRGREQGARAAYAHMARRANHWTNNSQVFNNRALLVSTLVANPRVSLVFMRLPDGNGDGSGFSNNSYTSLEKLWRGQISSLSAVNYSASYTKANLAYTLAAIMADYQASDIRTQNFMGYFSEGDHSDHIATAWFTRLAIAHKAGQQLTGYWGYQAGGWPVNVSGSNLTNKSNAFFVYGAYDDGVCNSWPTCDGGMYGDWLKRQYVAGRLISVTTPPTSNVNIARQALATASSQQAGAGQLASKAIDGSTEGWPLDYSREWATVGGRSGQWLRLSWPTPRNINRVVLYDRPNANDQITGASLVFSDGTSLPVSTLPNNGWPLVINFPSKITSEIRLNINSVSLHTSNIGLAEVEAWSN